MSWYDFLQDSTGDLCRVRDVLLFNWTSGLYASPLLFTPQVHPSCSSARTFEGLRLWDWPYLILNDVKAEKWAIGQCFGVSKVLAHLFDYVGATATKSLQSCLTLCDPIDSSPPGSPVPGILQARTLEWVAISFSNAWNWKVKVKSLSRVRPSGTPCTAAHQAPPSMGLSRP